MPVEFTVYLLRSVRLSGIFTLRFTGSQYRGTVPKYSAHPSCDVSDFVLGVGDFDLPLLVLTNSEFMDSDVSGGFIGPN